MQKKSIIVILCSLAAIMVAALVLVFSLNPLVSAMSKTPDTLVLTGADFKIKDHTVLGLKQSSAMYLADLYNNAYSGCGNINLGGAPAKIQIQIPEGVTALGDDFLNHCYYDYDYDYNGDGEIDEIGTNNNFSTSFKQYFIEMSVSLPSTLTTIGDSAFYSCEGLSEINIPNSVTTIGDSAFYNCSGLSEITIPNGVTTIGDCVFYYCYELSKINIPNSVTTIGDSAFHNCSGLSEITIPNGVTTIGNGAFAYCHNLQSINLPASVTEIGSGIFNSCDVLTEITVENPALYENPNFKYYVVGVLDQSEHFTFDENGALTGLSESGQAIADEHKRIEVTIPDGVTVVGTGRTWNSVFSGYGGNVITLELPDGLKKINAFAFCNCGGLTSVEIPNGVTTIGMAAFGYCNNLQSINIPASVTEIGVDIFSSSPNVEISVEDEALKSNPNLQRYFPAIIDQTEYFVFDANGVMIGLSSEGTDLVCNARDNGQKVTIKIPAGVTAVGRDDHQPMFQNWDVKEAINALILPDSLRTIKDGAFSGCRCLTKIEIPDGVTTIGNSAFGGCYLETVTVPASVVEVGEFAFGSAGTFTNNNGEYTKIIVGSSELYHNLNMAIYQDIMVKGYDASEDPTEPDDQNQQPTPVDPIDANPVQNPDQNEVSQVEQTVIANRANNDAVVAGVAGGSAAGVLVTCGIFGLVLIARRRR